MMTESFAPGQRWLSNNEPELGLGLVIAVARGRISLLFPASGQTRQYAASNVPLTRMRFAEGDEVTSHDGKALTVETVTEKDGALIYSGGGVDLPESGLADSMNFTKPLDRLLAAQLDDKGLFNLRSKCLHHRFETLRGHQRGFLGPRIDLLPHQLFAALQIRRKGIPRLVLADESGVGKTVESCLVLHRLLVTCRIKRALIVVHPPLFSRWQYELTRRFQLEVAAVDPAVKGAAFPEADIVLITPKALAEAEKLGWDLLIVDDADRMEAAALNKLCRVTPGVVLLTDLPPQTEVEAHERMRLLLDEGEGNADPGEAATRVALRLTQGPSEPWPAEEIAALSAVIGSEVDPAIFPAEQPDGRERVLAALLEAAGAGRRLLRNDRSTVEGLPEREALPQRLVLSEEPEAAADSARMAAQLALEFLPDGSPNPDFSVSADDPRLAWLNAYIEANPKDKIVLICATAAKAGTIAGYLGEKAALHHEKLDAASREKAIQRFGEKDERAAHVLVCSEFGLEARSLSYAHHLVVFDLPPNPVTIQKRIGNLDRFGHMAKVRVHVPYVGDTPAEVIFRWFHEALHLFEKALPVVHECGRTYAAKFRLVSTFSPGEAATVLEKLLPEAQHHADELRARHDASRNRLVDLASYRPMAAHRLLESIRRLDSDLSLDFLMLRLFDHFGFDAEDVGERSYNVKPREKDRDPEAFTTIGTGGQLVTFERQKAVGRDDLWFLTWDHPIVMNHVERVIKTTQGNSCYVVWEDLRSQILLLEALFRVELANPPEKLYPTRFFSPAGVRLIVNHELQEVGAEYPMELINRNVRNGRREWIRSNGGPLRRALPAMLQNLAERAQQRANEMSAQAVADLESTLLPELDRLKLLRERGGPATEFEIKLLENEIAELRQILAQPVVRLDSIRLVRRGPAGKGI